MMNSVFKNTVWLVLMLLLIASFNAFATTSEYAVETFTEETGDLFWDIDSEIRLKYISLCKYKDADCVTERGLRPIYKLREDGKFPISYQKNIVINGEKIEYLDERNNTSSYDLNAYFSLRHYLDEYKAGEKFQDFTDVIKYESDNYQKVFSALQTNSPVTVTIVSTDGEFERVIDTSHLDKSDEIKKTKHRNEYIFKILATLIGGLVSLFVFIGLVDGLAEPSRKIFVTIREKLTNIFSTVQKTIKPDVGIIKADKFKTYSVADELLKWAKLKEDGHISEEEYEEARKKLLNRD